MNTQREPRVAIDSIALKKDIKSSGTTAKFLSRAVGRDESYVTVAIGAGYIGEPTLNKIATLLGKNPSTYLRYAETPETPIVPDDMAKEIAGLRQDMKNITDILVDIAAALDEKLVVHTSQINARFKTLVEEKKE